MSKKEKEEAKKLGTSETERRLNALRDKPFAALAMLPKYETDNLKSGKYEVKITTYRDDLAEDGLQIVVQSYFHVRLGMGWIHADGFTISKQNDVESMEQEQLYSFM